MARITRRRFLQCGIGAVGGASLPWAFEGGMARAGMPGMGHATQPKLAKYVQPLPLPGAGIAVARPVSANTYAFTQREILRQLHPDLPPTPVWAYDDGSGLAGQAGSFGMAVVAHRGVPLSMRFTNGLPARYPARIPVDTRLTPRGDEVRVMTHLHGGFVAGESDGNPVTRPEGYAVGDTQQVFYPNEQAASLLWLHDHGMGTTRLNVFAGLAAAYILRDEFDTGLEDNPIGLPGGAYEIPLVIQDRLFSTDGTMRYPESPIPGVTWIGEYFGDTMLVNGKVWPFVDVEPRLYRLRMLNGCNARILSLDLGAATFWQVGSDGGLFDVPVPMRQLCLAPGERADVLVDFSRHAGGAIVLRNAPLRHPVVSPGANLLQVMQFRVGNRVTTVGPQAIPATLPGRKADLPAPSKRRFITLNESGMDTAGWTLSLDGQAFDDPVTENPKEGAVEEWTYVNMTGDTHPMHVHLVTFQVVGRTPFDVEAYEEAHGTEDGAIAGGIDPAPFATGAMQPPLPEERGFKDTVKADPGFFTTIRAKFDLPTGVLAPQAYVHHCHILEHEDNDMMRPLEII